MITQACQERDYQIDSEKATDYEKEQEKQELLDEKKADPPKCRVPDNFILALVPDPVHTHLALAFDRTIDVIEEAAQDEGYTFDRAILPWDSKTHIESPDYESRLQAEWYQKGREAYPGLITFRNGGEKHNQRLFVLAVAETPTGGIRKQQFLNAINVIQDATGIKDLRKDWRHNTNNEPGLRILGPTFSGSLDSLARILTCLDKGATKPRGCYPMVSIHSGSVSSRENIVRFEKQEQDFKIHLVSLHETDEVMIERFAEFLTGTSYEDPDYVAQHPYLSNRHYATREIAILSEDETAYGSSGKREEEESQQEDCDSDTSAARRDQRCVLKLYFPREVSQFRAAYQDSLSSPAPGDVRTPPRDTLPSNFSVPGSDDDTAASYSSKQMPLSQESVLLEIVSEIQRHRVKFIIVRATNPMDTLFLSRFLRKAYPQGRVVTIGADMLLRREAEDPLLHGVLALTTYSLAPSANHSFATFERGHVERIFPAAREVGTYNAMRSLLTSWVDKSIEGCNQEDTYDATVDCRHELVRHQSTGKKSVPELYQYGWLRELKYPPHYDAPPVQLLALGRDDYWPIATLGPFPGEKLVTTLPRVPEQISGGLRPVRVPNSWRIVQLAGILLGLGFSFSLWHASIRAKTQLDATFAPAALDGRAVVVLLAGLTMVLILLILQWPTVKNANPGDVRLDGLLAAALTAVFVCTFVDLLNRTLLAYRTDLRIRYRFRGWVWLVLFTVGSGLLIYQVFENQPEETPALLVRYATIRAMQLTSGLSFVMPTFFFLTVWLWWADHTAAGYALLDNRRPRLPKHMQEPRVNERLGKKALPALRGALRLTPLSVAGYAFLLLLFSAALWLLDTRPHPLLSLERPFLQLSMSLFFTLALGGVILATVRLWGIWLGLRKLLVMLDSLPLREGFKGIIQDFSWKPVWRIGTGSLEDFQRIFSRVNEALDCALNTYPIPTGSLTREWEEMMKCWEILINMKHPYTWDWWRRRGVETRAHAPFRQVPMCDWQGGGPSPGHAGSQLGATGAGAQGTDRS